MPDYKRMYTLLCAAVDDAIDPLERIPAARGTAERLKNALLEAEEIYVETSDGAPSNIIQLHRFPDKKG